MTIKRHVILTSLLRFPPALMTKRQVGAAAPTSPPSQVNSAEFRFHGGKRALNSGALGGSGYRRATTVSHGRPAVVQPREEARQREGPDFPSKRLRRTADEAGSSRSARV